MTSTPERSCSMPKTAAAPQKPARIGDAAVQAKTGKTWAEWFALLDKAGADQWPHKQIAAHLYDNLGCSGWWSQMVAVGYERERGLREKHERPDGYQVSRSKTLAVGVPEAYRAWEDRRQRKRWLADADFTVRKATPNRSLRITWVDGATAVEVMFYPKGEGKCQVTVQHSKLADAAAGERMKAYWGEQFDRLKGLLEA